MAAKRSSSTSTVAIPHTIGIRLGQTRVIQRRALSDGHLGRGGHCGVRPRRPKAPGGFALALVLIIAAMFAIGLWISAIARTAGGAGIIGQLFLFSCCSF